LAGSGNKHLLFNLKRDDTLQIPRKPQASFNSFHFWPLRW